MGSEENKKGFTLIELLIVLALSTVAITAGFLFVQGFKSSRDLEFDLAEAASAVKSTQKKSVTQENGKRWSIRFSATTTGPDKYEVYSGANYSSSSVDQLYTFRRGSSLSEPSGNRSKDLQFKPVTGKIDRKKIITLKHSGVNNFVGDIIVNKRGLVTKRLESDIIGYWHFNKGTGTSTIDATGNGNEGVFNGDPSWASVNGCR
ncbi:MAG: type II secretion system protein [Candidatus Magasanikbacteria bacterium]